MDRIKLKEEITYIHISQQFRFLYNLCPRKGDLFLSSTENLFNLIF